MPQRYKGTALKGTRIVAWDSCQILSRLQKPPTSNLIFVDEHTADAQMSITDMLAANYAFGRLPSADARPALSEMRFTFNASGRVSLERGKLRLATFLLSGVSIT